MWRIFVSCMILNCSIAYGMQEKQPPLLWFALHRAIEKEGYDTVWHKVDQGAYEHSFMPTNERYTFFWSELITKSDKSYAAQHLWKMLSEGPKASALVGEGVKFDQEGYLYAIKYNYSKESVLNLLREIKKSYSSVSES